jgi:hypothetical protein
VLAQLGADLSAAEELMNQGTIALQEALLLGLVDEATLQALAEAGGEWFQILYDSLFGVGALAELEAGWNDLTQTSIDALAALIPELEDGGAEIIDTLVEAIASGAISYEEALALLGDATGEQVNAILAELEALEAALTVQLAEAILAGNLELAAGLEDQLAIIEQFLAALEGRAVAAADSVNRAAKSMGMAFAAMAGDAASAADANDLGFDPFSTKNGGGGRGAGGGSGASSIYDLKGVVAETYRLLDPTPSLGEFKDWKLAQMEAGLLTPTGGTTAGFYNQYHPGALSPSMGGTPTVTLSAAQFAELKNAVREGAASGIAQGSENFARGVNRSNTRAQALSPSLIGGD